MTATFTLTTTKATKTVTGTIEEAIAAAIELDHDLQPAFGVTVSDENGNTVAEIRDGQVETE